VDDTAANRFATQWAQHWNSHDLEGLLSHFSDDVLWTSPVAAQIVDGSDGVLRGKVALRDYYAEGLRRTPELHFEVVGVYHGVNVLVINYRNHRGALVNEVLSFDDAGLVREGHGTYLGSGASSATGQ
jgi:ketosteroid isomerase-like protein